MKKLFLLFLFLAPIPAWAVPQSSGTVVTTCGVLATPYFAGREGPLTVDTTGVLCSTAGGGGGGGTSSTFGAAFPATGTAIGVKSGANMVNLTADGSNNLNININASSATVPVSGTVTVTATNLSTNEAQINGVTPLMGNGITGTGSQRVTIASDNTPFHTIIDTGSTTAVTQATAANLNAAVVGVGTAGAASGGVLTIQGVAAMTKLLVTPDSVALPANQSVNLSQVAGTTADTNSGTKSAGTLRVVLATDQPALTNKLLVTPDSVALPANQSVNESQVNGVTPLMGNGVTGTGSQRVTIASDNTAFSVNAQPVPTTSGGLTFYTLQPTASDNHANIKNGAGQVYHIVVMNNSATVNYLRLYNAGSGFNGCNSATNLQWDMIIPASTSGAGFVEEIGSGIAFATGISICVTSGYATTDTTNATATAMTVNIGYK